MWTIGRCLIVCVRLGAVYKRDQPLGCQHWWLPIYKQPLLFLILFCRATDGVCVYLCASPFQFDSKPVFFL